jgi:hypothetical protein
MNLFTSLLREKLLGPLHLVREGCGPGEHGGDLHTTRAAILEVLLHNGGFCNGCITKWILLLQAFHSQENQYYADYEKKCYIFY